MNQQFKPEQFKAYCQYRRPSVVGWYIGFGMCVLFFSILAALFTPPENPSKSHELLYGIVTGTALLTVPTAIGIFWWLKSDKFVKTKELLLIRMFQSVGWERKVYPAIQDYPVVPSSIIHNLNPENNWQFPRYMTFYGKLEGLPLECVFLDARPFVLDSKKAYLYIQVALPDSYPHTIVDGKDSLFRHDIVKPSSNVESVSLEGGLNDLFRVYTIKHSDADALYTLMPDVLEQLLDYGTSFNIEVIGNSLYVFSAPENLEDEAKCANFMNLTQRLAHEFNQRALSRGIKPGEFRYTSEYAQNRMEISSTITGLKGGA